MPHDPRTDAPLLRSGRAWWLVVGSMVDPREPAGPGGGLTDGAPAMGGRSKSNDGLERDVCACVCVARVWFAWAWASSTGPVWWVRLDLVDSGSREALVGEFGYGSLFKKQEATKNRKLELERRRRSAGALSVDDISSDVIIQQEATVISRKLSAVDIWSWRLQNDVAVQSQEIQAQRIEEVTKRSSRSDKSAAKQLTTYLSKLDVNC
ncbi:hypothetical protein F511_20776 [Dorcoceras hygrometricum]|uniref:Uncharacterized protein n=1 Tax=Dorcoceras hygrometricum TaxID=472368 RepID=A0A2Z7CQB0_9LAMI|nr:hypothetical protein F511_20776 [Dorcoceras hygrometricum]